MFDYVTLLRKEIDIEISNIKKEDSIWQQTYNDIKDILDFGQDKFIAETSIADLNENKCLPWKKIIEWRATFLKQNMTKQNRFLKECYLIIAEIQKELQIIHVQQMKDNDARVETIESMINSFTKMFENIVNSPSINPTDINKLATIDSMLTMCIDSSIGYSNKMDNVEGGKNLWRLKIKNRIIPNHSEVLVIVQAYKDLKAKDATSLVDENKENNMVPPQPQSCYVLKFQYSQTLLMF